MYQDRDSAEVFKRMHARDRVIEAAHHIGESSGDGYDLFGSHARAEEKDGRIGIVLSVVLFSALAVAATLFLG